MIDKEGFRLNVGIVVINHDAKLLWAKRKNTANAWQQFFAAYLRHLPDCMASHEGHVLPGVKNLLEQFQQVFHFQSVPVFTGNILRQPAMKNIDCRVDPSGYPIADKVMRGGILLACHHGLNDDHVEYMHARVSDFLNRFSAGFGAMAAGNERVG